MKKLFLIILLFSISGLSAQLIQLYSPNRQIEVRIQTLPNITWSVYYKAKLVLKDSKLGMQINNGIPLGVNQSLVSKQPTSILNNTKTVGYSKNSFHKSFYKGMILTFKVSDKKEYKIEFRVFNDGVAYRFITDFENELLITNELMELNFPKGTETYLAKEKQFISHNEQFYHHINMDTIGYVNYGSLPVLMKTQGVNLLFSETNLEDYPNMYLLASEDGNMTAIFPHIIKETRPDPKHPDRNELVVLENEEIARTFGKRNFPWRYFIMADNDADLINSNIPYQLAGKQKIWDTDWIKPGRVVWDWYNANAKYKKEFKKEIDTDTYKYYIDFAAKYGFEYILMDEGWSESTLNVTHPKPNIDIEQIISYGAEKNVGVILWLLWKPLDEQMDSTLRTYNKWGAKGIKVDFMQRNDQYMVNFYERVAKTAAKYKLIVDFHGSFKPVGLSRKYPNVLSYEGVKGNENNKWSAGITPEHTLMIPYIRGVVGAMDFTPGAMHNAHQNHFKISYDDPMSMGTRTRQVAMYVVYESPLQILCDAPTVYEKDPAIPQLISRIPTTWDETKVLQGKLGKMILIARRKGRTWYLAAMTNSEKREISLELNKLLSPGNYNVTIMEDGKKAKQNAESYEISNETISSTKKININMVEGGAWLGIFEPMHGSRKKKRSN